MNLEKMIVESGGIIQNVAFPPGFDIKMNTPIISKVQFRNCDLQYLDFEGISFVSSSFKNCRMGTFTNCKFDRTVIVNCIFEHGTRRLTDCEMRNCNIFNSIILGQDVFRWDISGTYIYACIFRRVNFKSITIEDSVVKHCTYADCFGREIDASNIKRIKHVPLKRGYVGWKKLADDKIAKLWIPKGVPRSQGLARKCRSEKARVLFITNKNGRPCRKGVSHFDSTFIYRIGKVVECCGPFNPDRWVECTSGIHHFLTKKEAVEYDFS